MNAWMNDFSGIYRVAKEATVSIAIDTGSWVGTDIATNVDHGRRLSR